MAVAVVPICPHLKDVISGDFLHCITSALLDEPSELVELYEAPILRPSGHADLHHCNSELIIEGGK